MKASNEGVRVETADVELCRFCRTGTVRVRAIARDRPKGQAQRLVPYTDTLFNQIGPRPAVKDCSQVSLSN
jgi:hypothetical protein